MKRLNRQTQQDKEIKLLNDFPKKIKLIIPYKDCINLYNVY